MGKIVQRTISLLAIKQGGILHGVNAQGKMGSGVAKALRDKYPQVYLDYIKDINARVIKPIKENSKHIYPHPIPHQLLRRCLLGSVVTTVINPELVVLSGYTQQYYGNDGDTYASIDAIVNCVQLSLLNETVVKHGLHIPLIGCGLGGLSWTNISRAIRSSTPKGCTITLCTLK